MRSTSCWREERRLAEDGGEAAQTGAGVELLEHLPHGVGTVLGEHDAGAVHELLPELILRQRQLGMHGHGARGDGDLAPGVEARGEPRTNLALHVAAGLGVYA